MSSQIGRTWTRRRFLRAAGAAAAGIAGVGVAIDTVTRSRPPATAGSRPASGSPGPTSPALAAAPGGSASVSPTGQGFHTRPDLVPPAITVESVSASVAPGYVFFTPDNGQGAGGPAIVDNTGGLVWMRSMPGRYVTDFRVLTYGGRQVLAWWEGSVNGGIGAGDHVLVDTSYREIARVGAANGRQMDLHEFQLTPQGTALFFADAAVPAPTPSGATPPPWPVLDCAIQEVDIRTGALLWEWHSLDHISIDESYVTPSAGQVFDYLHTNAISVEPDGTLLVSARNTSAIYKIDRTTGEIAWRLGGRRSDFRLGPGASFGWQHDVRRQPDGTLTIFDDEAPPVPARGIVLAVDETKRTASLVREYRRPTANLVQSQGNVQVLATGNVFVGWGSTPFYSEFSRDGVLLYDATFPTSVQSYRDYRFEWVGEPADVPAIAAEPSGTGMMVYASWNGATEVAAWEILGGPDEKALERVASSARTGFESAVPVTRTYPLVAARALDVTGRVLGTSAPLSTSTT